MGLFGKLYGKSGGIPRWNEIKDTAKVYPKNSISIIQFKLKDKLGTGWIDKAYVDYPYKINCPYSFLIKVDLTDSIGQKRPDLDMATIEDYFVNELRKICVTHIVARLVTETGLNIEMYLEKGDEVLKYLQTLSKNPERLVSFDFQASNDPKWESIKGLMQL
jgi:hypothetical protein